YTGGFWRGRQALRTCTPGQHRGARLQSNGVRQGGRLDDPRYRRAARIADAVLGGDIPDPTSGATHFLNEAIVRQRRGGSLPSWAQGEGLVIGRHIFYSPDEAGAGVGQANLALMFMQLASLSC